MARPKLVLCERDVESLAQHGCTDEEIATIVGCCSDTLVTGFSECLKRGRANLKMSLRRRQIAAADKGNVIMLIWLGKQLLGQADKLEQKHSGTLAIGTMSLDDCTGDVLRERLARAAAAMLPGEPGPLREG